MLKRQRPFIRALFLFKKRLEVRSLEKEEKILCSTGRCSKCGYCNGEMYEAWQAKQALAEQGQDQVPKAVFPEGLASVQDRS